MIDGIFTSMTFLVMHASQATYNHEDFKMKLFVLYFENDPMDWFLDWTNNSFDSLQAIINAFKDMFGDKLEGRYFLRIISDIKKNENENVEEFNKFNVIVIEMNQDYKPTDKSSLEHYLDAFVVDTSYELRRSKPQLI